MVQSKVLIVHVGNMSNKGTEALLKSDIAVIRRLLGAQTKISVSTTDVEGVKRLRLSLASIFPPAVDIPYEKADDYAKKHNCERGSWKYRLWGLSYLFLMPFEMFLSIFSLALGKAGFGGFYRGDFLECMKNSDVVLSNSDENYKEAPSFLPVRVTWIVIWWSLLLSRTWTILLAKYMGKRVVVFPNSVGPFRTYIGRCLAKLALNRCDFILVRESLSYAMLEKLHVNSPKAQTYDTAWLFRPSTSRRFEKDQEVTIGVSPGVYANTLGEKELNRHVGFFADALDRAIENFGFNVVFLPHYTPGFRYDDLEISKLIVQKMTRKDRTKVVSAGTAEEFKELLCKTDMVISSKMHPCVFAMSESVPTICVAYDQKQVCLFESLGWSKYLIQLYELSSGRLFSKICEVWLERQKIRSALEVQIPMIRQGVTKAITCALGQPTNGVKDCQLPSARVMEEG